MRVRQPAVRPVLPEACATAGDPLRVMKALSTYRGNRFMRCGWSGGRVQRDLAPPNAPHGQTLTCSAFEFFL